MTKKKAKRVAKPVYDGLEELLRKLELDDLRERLYTETMIRCRAEESLKKFGYILGKDGEWEPKHKIKVVYWDAAELLPKPRGKKSPKSLAELKSSRPRRDKPTRMPTSSTKSQKSGKQQKR